MGNIDRNREWVEENREGYPQLSSSESIEAVENTRNKAKSALQIWEWDSETEKPFLFSDYASI